MDRPLTRGRVNRMFKYFRNKTVSVRGELNDSMGGRVVRETVLLYDEVEIRHFTPGGRYMLVVLRCEGREVWFQEFDEAWWFVGLGKLEGCYSGPRCYFGIREVRNG